MQNVKINFNFLDEQKEPRYSKMEKILHEYGKVICEYAKGYFNYVVSTASENDDVREATLYIVVPEIGYNYKTLVLSRGDLTPISMDKLIVKFFTFKTEQEETKEVSITEDNWKEVYLVINELLNKPLTNETFRFLVNQVEMLRARND